MTDGSKVDDESGEGHAIAVIEDDPETSKILQLYLARAGFRVHAAADGVSGIDLVERSRPDLVVLDLMLPGIDGWSVCRRIRETDDTPVLILSARQEEQDRLLGLGLGADDYVVKPFSPREVVLRVQAILRRTLRRPRGESADAQIGRGPVRVDMNRRVAIARGEEIDLTPSEFKLLETFVRHPGTTFERASLIRTLYPHGGAVVPKAIDVHIANLRQKIEANPAEPHHILTVRGFGYRFEEGSR